MSEIQNRIINKLRMLTEEAYDTSWKDPNSPNYDRQWAEDALYHTVGPLMDNPRWTDKWTSRSEPVPGFSPNGPAPRWTPNEVVIAFAGDPSLLFKSSDNPRSPSYGTNGGAPLYRMAKKVSRIYARDRDPQFVADMYSNGFIPLVRMMQPGFDEQRSPFISYVMRNIVGAMEHGFGGTEEGIRAGGGKSTSGLVGLRGALESNKPEEVRNYANQVRGKYRNQKSHDKHPDNPFGPYSSRYYQTLNTYADALESKDDNQIEAARNQIQQLMDTIEDESIPIRGASTGMGQAISTQDRSSSVGVSSIDAERSDSEGATTSMSANIPGEDAGESYIDPESIYYVLDLALNTDIGSVVQRSPKYTKLAIEFGAEPELDGSVKVGGKFTANELRYVIRQLGPLGTNYPGKGKLRTATNVPRDANNWWKQGEDPEIEPIPNGGVWKSQWMREGRHEQMGPTEIAAEMTREILEFNKLGIKTARKIKTKIDSRGREVHEAITKAAVNNTYKSALIKLRLISKMHREQLGLDESTGSNIPIISEGLDDIDCRIILEACNFLIKRLQYAIMEVTPPSWNTRRLNEHKYTDNPFALAWWMKRKGYALHD